MHSYYMSHIRFLENAENFLNFTKIFNKFGELLDFIEFMLCYFFCIF